MASDYPGTRASTPATRPSASFTHSADWRPFDRGAAGGVASDVRRGLQAVAQRDGAAGRSPPSLEVNGAYLKLLGYRREDLIGHPIYELVVGGPHFSPHEWAAALAQRELTGEAELRCADGTTVVVHWGAHIETVTGQRLVLMVVLGTERWGGRFRRDPSPAPDDAELSTESRRSSGRGARQHRARDRRRAEHRSRHRANPRAQRDGQARSAGPARIWWQGRWATVTPSPTANSATAVSTGARWAADHVVVPDHDPWPTDSPPAAARLAAVVDDIDMRDQDEFDRLLVDLLRVYWPTVWTQDQ